MKDRFGLEKQLPPLTSEQREQLLWRALPDGHELTEKDVREVMEQVEGGSIRRLQGLGATIVNCARDENERKVPPKREHVLEALALVKEAEDEKAATRAAAQSARQSGIAGSRVACE